MQKARGATTAALPALRREDATSVDGTLLDGRFIVTVAIHSHDGGTVYAQREFEDSFAVMNPTRTRGSVHFPVKVEHIFSF